MSKTLVNSHIKPLSNINIDNNSNIHNIHNNSNNTNNNINTYINNNIDFSIKTRNNKNI